MIIGVDAGCLGIKDKRLKVGVYQFAKNFIEEIGKQDKKNQYLLYSFYPINPSVYKKYKNIKNIVVRPSRGWNKIWLPLKLIRTNPDIFLALNQSLPETYLLSPKYKIIGFIHDLAFEKYPEMYDGSLEKLRINSKNLVEKSDVIVTFSKSTKKDVVHYYKANREKIKVLHQGINSPSRCAACATPPGRWGNQRYFLFVGALKRIKNVPAIIKSFSYFLEKTNLDYRLKIVGGNKWMDPQIKETLNSLSLEARERIDLLGFVSENDLRKLYSRAFAFVSPSYYEGFGIPFLEAMASGVPVIASSKGSLSEIVDDSGILVNPKNHKEIGEAMVKLVKNKKLRNNFIKKGLKNVKKFSWKEFTKEIFRLINSSN